MSRLSSFLSIHNATHLAAAAYADPSILKLEIATAEWTEGLVEITLFLEDAVLADRLATAINSVVEARKAELQPCAAVEAA